MKSLIEWVKLLPTSVQIVVASILIGIGVTYAHEVRYMTVSDYTKSYVLDLKAAIREIREILSDSTLTERERALYEEELAVLIDELCYESPNEIICRLQEEDT